MHKTKIAEIVGEALSPFFREIQELRARVRALEARVEEVERHKCKEALLEVLDAD